MPIETANFISQLDPTNPAAPDLLADTDNHLRMIKQVLKNTFPNVNSPVTSTANQLMSTIPIGGIIMWNGNAASVPAGFALCNGQTVARSDGGGNIVTPNLTDRFIQGLNAAGNNAGVTGGAVIHTGSTSAAGAHSHTGYTDAQGSHNHGGAVIPHAITEAQMPSHTHGNSNAAFSDGTYGNYFAGYGVPAGVTYANVGYTGGNQAHTHAVPSDGSHAHNVQTYGVADHTHAVTIADGRPPFYVLAFIMKV